jgi:hypothetical protein
MRAWQGSHTLFEPSLALALQALWKHLEQPGHHQNPPAFFSSVQQKNGWRTVSAPILAELRRMLGALGADVSDLRGEAPLY